MIGEVDIQRKRHYGDFARHLGEEAEGCFAGCKCSDLETAQSRAR